MKEPWNVFVVMEANINDVNERYVNYKQVVFAHSISADFQDDNHFLKPRDYEYKGL